MGGGVDISLPNVSYCEDVKDVHYNPYNTVEFYVGNKTGTKPQTVKIFTDSRTSVDVKVIECKKWYTYVFPKDKGLCKIESSTYDDEQQKWSNGIVTKAVVKANINFNGFTIYPGGISFIDNSIVEASFKGSDTIGVTNMGNMFSYKSNLTSLDLSKLNTSNVTTMIYMFYKCSGLTFLDLSGWDTSNVTDMTNMTQMFDGCTSLNTIKMVGCSPSTIDKIKNQLTKDNITGVTITT